jgi:hypothetical protein
MAVPASQQTTVSCLHAMLLAVQNKEKLFVPACQSFNQRTRMLAKTALQTQSFLQWLRHITNNVCINRKLTHSLTNAKNTSFSITSCSTQATARLARSEPLIPPAIHNRPHTTKWNQLAEFSKGLLNVC